MTCPWCPATGNALLPGRHERTCVMALIASLRAPAELSVTELAEAEALGFLDGRVFESKTCRFWKWVCGVRAARCDAMACALERAPKIPRTGSLDYTDPRDIAASCRRHAEEYRRWARWGW